MERVQRMHRRPRRLWRAPRAAGVVTGACCAVAVGCHAARRAPAPATFPLAVESGDVVGCVAVAPTDGGGSPYAPLLPPGIRLRFVPPPSPEPTAIRLRGVPPPPRRTAPAADGDAVRFALPLRWLDSNLTPMELPPRDSAGAARPGGLLVDAVVRGTALEGRVYPSDVAPHLGAPFRATRVPCPPDAPDPARLARARKAQVLPPPPPATSGPLFDTLARLDSALYAATYGRGDCDPRGLDTLVAADAEFYDDVRGAETRAAHLARLRAAVPGCWSEGGEDRTLVPGTLRAYALGDSAAVQLGRHRFRRRGNGWTVESEFVTVWRREGASWRVSRSVDFGSRAVPME